MNALDKNLCWYAEQLTRIAKEYKTIQDKSDYINDCRKKGIAKNLRILSKNMVVVAREIEKQIY